MSAKEMFEKLGYDFEEVHNYLNKFLKYKKRAKIIVFRSDKVVIPYEDYGEDGEDGTLLNLNKQIEELGWK